MLRHLLARFLPPADDDGPRTVTYYVPRRQPVDPREAHNNGPNQDVRQVVGHQLSAGFDWAPRRPVLTVILSGDPTAPGPGPGPGPGPDEIETQARVLAAIARWGVRAA